jgi:simple sugar transport system permease protein
MSTVVTPARSTPQAQGSPERGEAARERVRTAVLRPEFGVLLAALVLYAFFAVVAGDKGFLTQDATAGWLGSAAEIGIVALGASCLLIAGEFDLSIGSMVGAGSAVMGIGVGHYELSIWICVLIAAALAVAVGLANAFLTLKTGLPSFIVTLAMMLAVAGGSLGMCRLLTGTTNLTVPSEGAAHTVFGGTFGALSSTVFWWVGLGLLLAWMLRRTVFGNWTYAVGGDIDAAVTNGVPVARVKASLFVLSSLCAALVGVLQTVQFSSGDATRGADFVFSAVAAAVIGGTLLSGGYGTATGIMMGGVTYGIVNIGVFYTGWSTDWTSLFLGGLVLMAVLANDYFRKLALAAGKK